MIEEKAEAIASLCGREPQNLEEQALCLVGKDIFEKLIKEYTEKQWGRSCNSIKPDLREALTSPNDRRDEHKLKFRKSKC